MKKSELLKAELAQLVAEDEQKMRTIEDWKEYWESFGRQARGRRRELEEEIHKEENREIEVGDGVTEILWSDCHAGTVIARTKTTLTMQLDKATLDPNFKPEWIAGGFAGHCTNQEDQKYTYERNPEGEIIKFRWSEKYGRWQTSSDGSIRLRIGRHEFYDYNF